MIRTQVFTVAKLYVRYITLYLKGTETDTSSRTAENGETLHITGDRLNFSNLVKKIASILLRLLRTFVNEVELPLRVVIVFQLST